jgi:hypothetical protein
MSSVSDQSNALVAYCKRLGGKMFIHLEVPTSLADELCSPGRRRVLSSRCRPVKVVAVNQAVAQKFHRPSVRPRRSM